MAKSKYTSIGGSALIEGVMMRNGDLMSIAVRKANGQIILKTEKVKNINKTIAKIPILRGIVSFIMSMITSYKSLMYSADVSMEDIADEQPESKFDAWLTKALGKGLMNVITVVASVLATALGIVLFFYLPTLFTDLFSKYIFTLDGVTKRVIVGVIKMIIFICYMLLVSCMEDMKRVFMYHGAEHKTIFCYEAKGELSAKCAKNFKRFHPRCGTSFIVISLLVSFAASLIIPWKDAFSHSVLKLLILPLVMGIAYECIKLAGRVDNTFTRIISAPGLWVQRITTREPDESQLEVAVAALRGAIEDLPQDTRLILNENGEFIPENE